MILIGRFIQSGGRQNSLLFAKHTLILNLVDKIWLKRRFFDKVGSDGTNEEEDILAITRNFDCNEFLGEDDLKIFEQMKKNNPRRYSIEGEGNWGIAEGLIFENWQELEFDIEAMKRSLDTYDRPKYKQLFGMDFGYTNDPTAFIALMVDEKNKEIFIFDEIYKTYMKNEHIRDAIKYKGYDNQRIAADSSAPKDIDTLKDMGLYIYGARNLVIASIQVSKSYDYKMYVHPDAIIHSRIE